MADYQQPDELFGPLSAPLGGEGVYRSFGGVTVGDMYGILAQQALDQRAQQQQALEQYQAEQASQQAAAEQGRQAAQQMEFIDWPTYQRIATESGTTDPWQQHQDYANTMLPSQLQGMGYDDQQISQLVNGFLQAVPPPQRDEGVFGNLWSALSSGAESGTRASELSAALASGNTDRAAELLAQGATQEPSNAPMGRFEQYIQGEQPDWWEATKGYLKGAFNEPQGFLDWVANQAALSYPSLAGGAAGAAVGTLGGPVGTVIGGALGVGAGSGLVDFGSEAAQRISQYAQANGIDPTNVQAIRALLNTQQGQDIIKQAAEHAGSVAALDTASAALAGPLGSAAARNLSLARRAGRSLEFGPEITTQAGRTLRNRGLAQAATGIVAEPIAGALGEAGGEVAAGDPNLDYNQILGEIFGSLHEGVAEVGAGAAHRLLTRPSTNALISPPVDTTQGGGGGADITEEAMQQLIANGDDQIRVYRSGRNVPFIVTPGGTIMEDTPANRRNYELFRQAGGVEPATIMTDQGVRVVLPEVPPLLPAPGTPLSQFALGTGETDNLGPIQTVQDAARQNAVDQATQTYAERGGAGPTRALPAPGTVPIRMAGPETTTTTPFQPALDQQRQQAVDQARAVYEARGQVGTGGVLPAPGRVAVTPNETTAPFQPTLNAEQQRLADENRAMYAARDAEEARRNKFLYPLVQAIAQRAINEVQHVQQIENGNAVNQVQPAPQAQPAAPVPPAAGAAPITPTPAPTGGLKRGFRTTAAGGRVARSPLATGQAIPSVGGLADIARQLTGNGPASPQNRAGPASGLPAGVGQKGAAPRRGSPLVAGKREGAPAANYGAANVQPGRAGGGAVRNERAATPSAGLSQAEKIADMRRQQRTRRKNNLKAVTAQQKEVDDAVDKMWEVIGNGKDPDGVVAQHTDDLIGVENLETRSVIDEVAGPQDRTLESKQGNLDASAASPLHRELIAPISQNNVQKVVEWLSTNANNPITRVVMDAIRTLGLKTTIEFNTLPEGVNGRYVVNSDHIIVSPFASERDVAHEIVHAATTAALDNPQNEVQQLAQRRLVDLMAQYTQDENNPRAQRLMSLNPDDRVAEFVTEALTDPKVQQAMQQIEMGGKPSLLSNLWASFKAAVLRLLGRDDTMLAHVLTTAPDVFMSRQDVEALQVQESPNQRTLDAATNRSVRDGIEGTPSTAITGTDKNGLRTWIAYADKKDPNYFTLYPANAQHPEGVPKQGVSSLTRADVEATIQQAGHDVHAPTSRPRPALTPVAPKTTSSKIVGYDESGGLKTIAFEQGDGSWNVYTSDTNNVTTDSQAQKVSMQDRGAVEAYLARQGQRMKTPPSAAKATGNKILYKDPYRTTVRFQDKYRALMSLAEATVKSWNGKVPENLRIDFAKILRNSNIQRVIKEVEKQYVEPVRAAGARVMRNFHIDQGELEHVWRTVHTEERTASQIRRNVTSDPTLAQSQADARRAAQQELQAIERRRPGLISAMKRDFLPVAKRLSDANISLAEKYGLIDAATSQDIRAAYEFYAPLQYGDKTTIGKSSTGRNYASDMTMARIMEQTYLTAIRGEQNRIRQIAFQLAQGHDIVDINNPNKKIVEIGPLGRVKFNKQTHEIEDYTDALQMDPQAIAVYVDGKAHRMKIVSDPLRNALRGFKQGEFEDPDATAALIGAAGKLIHIMSLGKTALNYAFPIFNMFRDVGTASFNLPSDVSRGRFLIHMASPRMWLNTLDGVFREAAGGEGRGTFKRVTDAGGFVTMQSYMGTDDFVRQLRSTFAPTTTGRVSKEVKGLLKLSNESGIFRFVTGFSQVMESVTRHAVFLAAKDAGKSDTEAAVLAKTASVNFEDRGETKLSPLYMFANAKIQGLAAMGNKFRQETKAAAAMATGLITLGAITAFLGYKYSDRDKDGKSKFEKIPGYKRDTLVLWQEGKPGVPLPQEIAPFYVLGNAIASVLYGKADAGDQTSRILTNLLQTFAPLSVPQEELAGYKANKIDFLLRTFIPSQMLPLYDITTNRNTFGSPIVRNKDENLARGIPLADQHGKNEPSLAVNVAQGLHSLNVPGLGQGAIDFAPAQLRLLANAYLPTEAYAFWRDLFGGRGPRYQGEIVNPIERRFTGTMTPFYDEDQFQGALSDVLRVKGLANNLGSRSRMSEDDRALIPIIPVLEQANNQIKQQFRGYKGMSDAQIQQAEAAKQHILQTAMEKYYRAKKGG